MLKSHAKHLNRSLHALPVPQRAQNHVADHELGLYVRAQRGACIRGSNHRGADDRQPERLRIPHPWSDGVRVQGHRTAVCRRCIPCSRQRIHVT